MDDSITKLAQPLDSPEADAAIESSVTPKSSQETSVKSKSPLSKKLPLIVGGVFVMILLVTTVAGLGLWFINRDSNDVDTDNTSATDQESTDREILPVDYDSYKFADYVLEEVNVEPQVESYADTEGLDSVYYIKKDDPNFAEYAKIDEVLTDNMKQVLGEDLFIITEGNDKEFFTVYEENRYSYVPNFVTTDSIMHTYHLIFDSILKNLEKEYMSVELEDLSKMMVEKSIEQYNAASNEDYKDSALRNVAYFSVGSKLLDPNFEIPEIAAELVNSELAKIESQSGIDLSPIMTYGIDDPNIIQNYKEDYSQYIPRGHYAEDDSLEDPFGENISGGESELSKYFKAMMWFGRMTFLSSDESNTKSAILIVESMRDQEVFNKWESVYSPINFFVGKSDDLTFFEYNKVLEEEIGDRSLMDLTAEELSAVLT